MKKLYTLAALAFAAMGANADVVLTIDGKVIDPAQTATVYARVNNWGDETDPFIIVDCGMDNPKLVNQGKTSANYSVTVETKDYAHFQWCFPDSCNPLTQATTTFSHTLAAGADHLLLLEPHVADIECYGPDYYCSYEAKVTIKEGSKSTTYNLQFVYDESCDAKAGLSNNVSSITADSKNAPIYDLTGRKVNNPVAGQLYIQGGRKMVK